jgi:hypothetical protein
MALLGGACKMGGGIAVPLFTDDPYGLLDSYPQPATARIEMSADGAIEGFKGGGSIGDIGRWDGGSGSLDRSDYDFRLDHISGSLSGTCDSQDVWIAGSTAPSWCVHVAVPIGLERFEGTLRVRPSGGGADFDTANVQLEADLS